MFYNLGNEVDTKRFLTKVQYLVERKKKIELTEKREKRTLNQNSYLHLLISFFAIETGNTIAYVKDQYFKILCNPDLFIFEKEDPFLGKIKDLRSSRDLDTKQMTVAIDRFRNWSSSEAGIYLPEANEHHFLEHIQNEINKKREWL